MQVEAASPRAGATDQRLEDALRAIQPPATADAARALRRLASTPADDSWRDYLVSHRRKLAAVLVMLSIDDTGHLQVTLTTRALTLRTSPGETALPGGRVEPEDTSVLDTALREAQEEIALPVDASCIHLTTLPAFLSYTLLLVIPVVVFLASPATTVLPKLVANAAEVSAIFHTRLDHFLGAEGGYAHSFSDVPWIADADFRLHAFRHPAFASDVTGLTAEILVQVALLAADEGTTTAYEREAVGQLSWATMVRHVLEGKITVPRRAGIGGVRS